MNIKFCFDKKKMIRLLSKEVHFICQKYKKDDGSINEKDISYLDSVNLTNLKQKIIFIKNAPITTFLTKKFSECEILSRLIFDNDKEHEIEIQFNDNVILNVKKQIICVINYDELINRYMDLDKRSKLEDFYITYYTVPDDFYDDFYEKDIIETTPYFNTVYDFHKKSYLINDIYSEIGDKYNLSLIASIYNGAVRNSNIFQIDAEILTGIENDSYVNNLILTPNNIEKHLTTKDALFYMYENYLYSSPKITSFKVFLIHLKAIKKYTQKIEEKFLSNFTDKENDFDFRVYMQYKPDNIDYKSLVEGTFEIKIRNFIADEEISIPVTSLDIAYCNIEKVLLGYYHYNRNLKNIVSEEDFLNNPDECLKTLVLCSY